jgi:hypothetical protein
VSVARGCGCAGRRRGCTSGQLPEPDAVSRVWLCALM